MRATTAIAVLALAALLEAAGDFLARSALRSTGIAREGLFVAAALTLLTYGIVVNLPPWKFGELLGLYVVFFFVFAQAIGWVAYGERPSFAVIIGGAFIVTGGLLIIISRRR